MSLPAYDALASRNTEKLRNVIKANPIWETVEDLANAYCELGSAHPSEVDSYAAALVELFSSPDLPFIHVVENGESKQQGFNGLLVRDVYEAVATMLYESVDPTIDPHNSYIHASLLSGAAIRSGLCISSQQVAELGSGLHIPWTNFQDHWGPEKYEVYAIGACIQVLAAGNAILKADLLNEKEIVKGIEEIREIVKHPGGQKIVEAAQKHAADGFKKPLTSAEIWKILFP